MKKSCLFSLRSAAVDRMCYAFKFHVATLYFILTLKIMLPPARTMTLVASFCSCVSMFCLSERMWSIQGENLFIWSRWMQGMFSASRFLVRALSVAMVGLWVAVGWTVYGK